MKSMMMIVAVMAALMMSQTVLADGVKPENMIGQNMISGPNMADGSSEYLEYPIDRNEDGKVDRLMVCYSGSRETSWIYAVVLQVDDLDYDGIADKLIILKITEDKIPHAYFSDNKIAPEYVEMDFVIDLEKQKFPIDKLNFKVIFAFYVVKTTRGAHI